MIQRNTYQRSLVLGMVRELKCHATADDIYEKAKEHYPSISRTTVYRNLQQLSEAGEIRKVEFPGSPDRYDHNTMDHYHIKCSACGKVSDVEMEYIPDMQNKIRDSYGYRVCRYDIIFTGVCPDCQAEGM